MTLKIDRTLSSLARRAEKVLKSYMDDMEKDIKAASKGGKDQKYSLTDLMKVTDRILKLEDIRNKSKTDETGGFFNEQDEEEGAEDDTGTDDEQDEPE